MKKKIVVFFAVLLAAGTAFSQGTETLLSQIISTISKTPAGAAAVSTFDITSWLTALDNFYQGYDMLQQTIKQVTAIEQQIQQTVEGLQSFSLDGVWDGDFDIRDDVKRFNRRLSQQTARVQAIQTALETPIDFGYNTSASMMDLVNVADVKTWANKISNLMQGVWGGVGNNIIDGFSVFVDNNLTERQKREIRRRYGISPQAYAYVMDSTNSILEKGYNLLAKASESFQETIKEEADMIDAMTGIAENTLNSEGTPTQEALMQATLEAGNAAVQALSQLELGLNDFAGFYAGTIINEIQKQQLLEDGEKESLQIYKDHTVLSVMNFTLGDPTDVSGLSGYDALSQMEAQKERAQAQQAYAEQKQR